MMRVIILIVVGLVLASSQGRQNAIAREWKDASGTFSIEAEFVEYVRSSEEKKPDGTIVKKPATALLRKGDRTTVSVPMSRLSKADLEYVQSVLREQAAKKSTSAKPFIGTWTSSTFQISPDAIRGGAVRISSSDLVSHTFTFKAGGKGSAIISFKEGAQTLELTYEVDTDTDVLTFKGKNIQGTAHQLKPNELELDGTFSHSKSTSVTLRQVRAEKGRAK